MWKLVKTGCASIALLGLSISPAIAAPITLRSAMQDGNTYKFDPKNIALPGICTEIIRAIEKTDPEIKFSGMDSMSPLPRILSEMGAGGSVDTFCGLLKNPERAALVNYIEVPIYTLRHKIAVRADDQSNVKSFDDIRKLGANNTIAATQGLAYSALLHKEGGLSINDSSRDNSAIFKMLIAERVRFFYHAESTLREYIDNDKLEGKVKILPTVFKEENQYFVVSKTLPLASVEKLKTALDKLAKSGDLAKIYARYSGS